MRDEATGGRVDSTRRSTSREAIIAALPPLLFGLGISLSMLLRAPLSQLVIGGPTRVRYGPGSSSVTWLIGVGVLVAVALVLVTGGVIAALRRLPVWGHTWTGGAVMVITIGLVIAGDDKQYLVSPVADILIMLAMMLLMGAALGASGWSGPLLGGLTGISTTMILSLTVVSWASNAPFSRWDIALLAGPLGLLYGGLLYGFVSGSPARRRALLAAGGLLCLGTLLGTEYGVFWQWRLGHGQTGQVWTLMVVGAALLAFGPVVGLVTRRLKPQTA